MSQPENNTIAPKVRGKLNTKSRPDLSYMRNVDLSLPELETISRENTTRAKNTIDKVLEPINNGAQNVLSPETFQTMIDSVIHTDLPENEKIEMYRQLIALKDESDQKHADMLNENLRVRAEVAKEIQTNQGLTWDQIGNMLVVAGKIGAKALQVWMGLKMYF